MNTSIRLGVGGGGGGGAWFVPITLNLTWQSPVKPTGLLLVSFKLRILIDMFGYRYRSHESFKRCLQLCLNFQRCKESLKLFLFISLISTAVHTILLHIKLYSSFHNSYS